MNKTINVWNELPEDEFGAHKDELVRELVIIYLGLTGLKKAYSGSFGET